MPLNIAVGLVALVLALVAYSIGAWGAFRSKALSNRHVTYLLVGFVFDVIATVMMGIQAGGLDLTPLSDLLHTVVALVAMFGMLVVAILGWSALKNGNDAMQASLARWVLVPWALWVLVFLWGMAARGSQRMG